MSGMKKVYAYSKLFSSMILEILFHAQFTGLQILYNNCKIYWIHCDISGSSKFHLYTHIGIPHSFKVSIFAFYELLMSSILP